MRNGEIRMRYGVMRAMQATAVAFCLSVRVARADDRNAELAAALAHYRAARSAELARPDGVES